MAQIGYRRKGDSTPHYHPERDYAYITPTIMRIAIESLDAHDPPERMQWRLDHGVTQGEIVKLSEALAKAQSDFVNAVDPVKSFEAALERHGFYEFNYEIRQYLFSAIGEVCCAAWFTAVREVTMIDEEPPAAVDMARFTTAVSTFVKHNGLPVADANYVAEYRRMQSRVLESRLEDAKNEIQKYRSDYYKLLSEFNALKTAKETPAEKPSCGFFSFLGKLFRKNDA